MSSIRRRLMAQVASDSNALPAGCVRCEYLESDATNGQYIDTERRAGATDVIRVSFALHSNNNGKAPFGWRWSGTYKDVNNFIFSVRTPSYFWLAYGIAMTKSPEYTYKNTERIDIEISPNNKSVIITGGAVHTISAPNADNAYNGVDSVYNVTLFGENLLGSVGVSNSRFYEYIVVSQDGTVKQHLIPILDSNGTPCMYDVVNKRYHYNQRGEDFKYKLL